MTKRFRRGDDGVVAIEFAILALPFFLLLFAILELAVVFFVTSTLDHAVSTGARFVRTGQLQVAKPTASGQLETFREEICKRMSMFKHCESKLHVTLLRSSNGVFEPVAGGGGANNTYECSGPREVVILRAAYHHPLTLPRDLTQLGNHPDDSKNVYIIGSTTAFRNEPFPNVPGGSCGTATLANPTTGGAPTPPTPGSPTSPSGTTTSP